MTRTVVLIGGNGQLGQDLARVWARRFPDDRLVSLTHAQISVEDPALVDAVLPPLRPDLVINTSAYHKVDLVEETPGPAFAVNATGPLNLARACRRLDAELVHFSTDYVFSGRLQRPHTEADRVDPINVYGVSKAAGEMLVAFTHERHFLIRSCGLYGLAGSAGKGGNFVETMLRKAEAGEAIRVVDDQVLTPTATPVLAEQVAEIVQHGEPGLYHATCQAECSWYDFAAEIFRQSGLNPNFRPQSTAEAGSAATRPRYSVLENAHLKRLGIDVLPTWQEALAVYLSARAEARRAQTV